MGPSSYGDRRYEVESPGRGCGCLLAIFFVVTIGALIVEVVFGVDFSIPVGGY
jgi:hypothetical protein